LKILQFDAIRGRRARKICCKKRENMVRVSPRIRLRLALMTCCMRLTTIPGQRINEKGVPSTRESGRISRHIKMRACLERNYLNYRVTPSASIVGES